MTDFDPVYATKWWRRIALGLVLFWGLVAYAAVAEPYKMTFYLVSHWLENGQQFCKYGNGTILNVGYSYCPWSIRV